VVVNWGSIPDWIAGVGTTGTLLTGMLLFRQDRHRTATEEADNLRATLDVEGEDYSRPANLTMTICNFGRTTFWDVRVYRCAEVVDAKGENRRQIWYVAELDFVDAQSTYRWTVEHDVLLGTGRAPHPRSFESFVHRGITYARYRRKPLRPVRQAHHRRALAAEVREFEERPDLVRLHYGEAKVERRW
jgi:hypothetical protein